MLLIRKFSCCLFLFGMGYFSSALCADLSQMKDPMALLDNELARLDTLIQATQTTLDNEKNLRILVVEYKQIQEQYLKAPNDNDLLFKMVKSAFRTLKSIKENHLVQTFDPEFIDELTVISQPATKRGIPRT